MTIFQRLRLTNNQGRGGAFSLKSAPSAMKDKLITISLFIIAAMVLAGFFIASYENAFEKVQDNIVTNIKQVEHY